MEPYVDNGYNRTCFGAHSKAPRTYTYIIDEQFSDLCIFFSIANFVIFLPTILLNAVILVQLLRNSKLRIPRNISLISICTADLLVGLIVQPIYASHIVKISQGDHVCSLSNFLVYTVPILVVVTMVTHSIISLERYFSVAQQQHYHKLFTKSKLVALQAAVWTVFLLCYIVPFITGNPVIGTKIIIVTILLSIGASLWCYISIYQTYRVKDGRTVAEMRGAYVITSYEPSDITPEEDAQIVNDVRLSKYYFVLYAIMLVFYLTYLVTRVLVSYDAVTGNSRYLAQFGVDTVLFVNALVNPFLILHNFRDIRQYCLPSFCQ